ncbi:MAG: carbohydrate ABC transporter permease [Thermoproteus sp.]
MNRLIYFLVFSAPALLFLFIYIIYPLALDIASSFTNWSPATYAYVGLQNYQYLFTDPLFAQALETNLIWLGINVPVSMFLGMLFALLLTNENAKGARAFRTMVFAALAIPPTVAAFMFGYMLFAASTGVINAVFFGNKLNVFGLYWPGLLMMVLMTIWSSTPLATIIYMAGIAIIPRSVIEAASIDGAPLLTRFARIYLPLLRPAHIVAFVMLSILTLKVFDVVYTLRAPGGASVLLYYMYQNLSYGAWGYANSVIVVISAIVIAIAIPLTIAMFRRR